MSKLSPEFSHIWVIVTIMAAISTILLFLGLHDIAEKMTWVGLIMFAAVEYVAQDAASGQGYYTSWFWNKVESDLLRWLCGLWLACICIVALSFPFNYIIGGKNYRCVIRFI